MTDELPSDLDQLIDTALLQLDNDIDDPDSPASLRAVAELHKRTDAATLAAAVELCKSADDKRKRLGAIILGQLGYSNNVFREERYAALEGLLLAEMATAASPEVLNDVCVALGHLIDRRAVPIVLKLIGHPSAEVRFGVVAALSCHEDEAAIAGLIRLSTDDDDDVRDWATFGLGQLIDADTAAIRAVLHARLEDANVDVRSEAIGGLARRQDKTILPVLVRELNERVASPLLEAARDLADPSLCAALLKSRKIISEAEEDEDRLASSWRTLWLEAMAACGCRLDDT